MKRPAMLAASLAVLMACAALAAWYSLRRPAANRLMPCQTVVYMPLVASPPLIFGAQMETPSADRLAYIPPGQWVQTPLYWSQVEIRRGLYKWPAADDAILPDRAHPVILALLGSPPWAQSVSGYACSMPLPETWPAYAEFAIAAIDRYQVQAVALWREPEPAWWQVDEGWSLPYYGCWGDVPEVYAQFTRIVSSAIKARRPTVKIITGEFMAIDFTWSRRALDAGMAGDYVAFHCYDVYGRAPHCLDVLLAMRGMTDKPLIWSEIGLQTDDCQDAGFVVAQAEYAGAVRGWLGWYGVGGMWYTVANNGWRCTDLNNNPARYKWFGGEQ